MSEFVVYSVLGSPFGRAVLATLEEKGAAYRFHAVQPGTLKAEPHISRHPFGRIPVLEHGDFMLYETQAMLRYIDRVAPGPSLTPADPKSAARMDQQMNICDWYLFMGVNQVIGFQRIVAPRLMGLTPDEAAIAEAMPRAHAVVRELSRLLGNQDYFAGDRLTLADIHIGTHLDFLSATPEWQELTRDAPNLVRWLARINGRASFQATTWDKVTELAKAA